ncbi:TetR/AcrR family transcriptional regulator [Gordonia aurantiaca]|uniref:TetR/AcrR family transcriptional regulator n=1 Tax=Gordonia sp. B21 TaxID=3151852 RepID=UPI0032631E47
MNSGTAQTLAEWVALLGAKSETRTDAALLDASAALLGEVGERNLTIDQVAERAGRSRMTVFRRFGSREELIVATYRRELRRVLETVTDAVGSMRTVADRVELLFNHFLDSASTNPVSVALIRGEPDALVKAVRGGPEFSAQRWMEELCAALLSDEELEDPLARDEAEFVGGLILRLVLALLLLPTEALEESRASRREFLRKVAERVVAR